MLIFVLRRTFLGIVIILLAVTTLYCLVHAAPGNPIDILLGPRGSPAMKAALEARLGLDRPLPVQILKFLGSLLEGDLGLDIKTRRPVVDLVLERLPKTIALLAASLFVAAACGIPLGCFAATHRDSLADRVVGVASVSVISIPPLIIAIYGLLLFAAWLKWVPAVGAGERGDLMDQLASPDPPHPRGRPQLDRLRRPTGQSVDAGHPERGLHPKRPRLRIWANGT